MHAGRDSRSIEIFHNFHCDDTQGSLAPNQIELEIRSRALLHDVHVVLRRRRDSSRLYYNTLLQ